MIIDTHFHTNVYLDYVNTLEDALQLAAEKEIYLLSNTVNKESYVQTMDIAKLSKYVIPCFGIHPQIAHECLDTLHSLDLFFNEAIAFGEIGLDHYYVKDESQYPAQYTLLEHFFKIALDHEKLVILHLDGAEEQGLKLIKKYSLPKVIIHGYRGSISTIPDFLDYGCYFSVGGNMIMEKFKPFICVDEWKRIMQILIEIPNERILLETDGPCRMEPNADTSAPRGMPDYIFKTLQRVADIKGVSQEFLQKTCLTNFKTIIKNDFGLLSHFDLLRE
ncbi:MAG: TatD family hydrolase [Candidatus Heimdallarchaeota archaeon]|nr:TatD family hydrolase [Candidatus Heimdallarchaeota archaeon]